jgi:hypothetical protein
MTVCLSRSRVTALPTRGKRGDHAFRRYNADYRVTLAPPSPVTAIPAS